MVVSSVPQKASYLSTTTPLAACQGLNGVQVVITATKLLTVVVGQLPTEYDITGLNAKDVAPLVNDQYVLALSNGLAVYSLSTGLVKKISLANAAISRVKVRNGYVLHQTGNTISIYDQSLVKKASQAFGVTELLDFELDANNFLYTCGFQQQKNPNANNLPVQIAFLYKMQFTGTAIAAIPNSPTGENLGKLWGYNAGTLSNNMADTRMNRLFIKNGKLYCLGSVYGGNSIFRYNGKDLSTPTLISGDIYTQTSQTRDETGTYIGIVDLINFVVIRGVQYRTRLDSNDGNNLFPKTIYSDGTDVYVGGVAAYKMANRANLTWLNQPLAPYQSDTSLLVVSDSLSTRRAWITPGQGEPLLFTDVSALVKTTSTVLTTTDGSVASQAYSVIW